MSSSVTVAIPAGGKGTRFHPYTELIPKPLIPVGPEEKPITEYILCWLRKQGFRDFVMLVGHKWKSVVNYFGDGGRWGARIVYSLDDEKFTNTGGALLKAYLKGILGPQTLIWYGDIIALLNARELVEKHISYKADATLVLADKYQVPVGVAKISSDGRVIGLEEKPWLDMKVTIGILVLNTNVLSDAEKELGTTFDVMGELIPWMIKKDYVVRAYIYTGPWWDVGSLERYKKLNADTFTEFFNSCRELEKQPLIYT